MELPAASVERIAKNSGVERISQDGIKELGKVVEEIGEELARDAAKVAQHTKRNTIMLEDIILVSGKKVV